ncbi:MAG: hypothetical protein JSV03_01185 [Planctomycetota bacterium]|nr:MAG: hypothetical protein JSV03_01185 [Planctomycetota bacterium]
MKVKLLCFGLVLVMAGTAWGTAFWTGAVSSQWGDPNNWNGDPTVYGQWFVVDNTVAKPYFPEWDPTVPNGIRGLSIGDGTLECGEARMDVIDNNNGVGDWGVYMGLCPGNHVLNIDADFGVATCDWGFRSGNIRVGYTAGYTCIVNINAFLNTNCRYAELGNAPGATGIYNVNADGSVLVARSWVGHDGYGIINVNGGSYVSYDGIWVGCDSSDADEVGDGGEINISSGEIISNKYVSIGQANDADSVLNITGGQMLMSQKQVNEHNFFCGATSTADGAINLSGDGYLACGPITAQGNNKNRLLLGNAEYGGVGTVNISDNAELFSRDIPEVYVDNGSCINLLTPDTAVLRVKRGPKTKSEDLITSGAVKNWEGSSDLCDFTVTKVKASDSPYPFQTFTITALAPLSLPLDVLPSDCPNELTQNMRSKGRLAMAILGSEDLDVVKIDPASISIGGVVFPVKTPHIEDVSGSTGDPCACGTGVPDGYDDLVLHFSRRDLLVALGLDELDPGTEVQITVKGALRNCRKFEATDCITLVARED